MKNGSQMKIYVVIPNWNGKHMLGACLDSVYAQSLKPSTVIVVDNGSTDGSVEYVEENYPEVTIIRHTHNRGFAGGVNAGLRLAIKEGADLAVLFNNDAVASSEWLSKLVQVASDHPEAGIVTSKILLEKNKNEQRIDSTGDFYSHWGLVFPRGRDEIDTGQYDQPEEVFGASGGASLYRIKMLKEIGLFDEDFFAYFEDVDISFRAQLAGWKVRYEPSAMVYHGLSKTSSRHPGFSRYHSIKNYVFLYYKNMPGWLFWRYFPYFVLMHVLVVVRSLARGQFVPVIKGVGMAILKFPATLSKRHQIQSRRKVSVEHINSILYHDLPPLQRKKLGLGKRA